MIDDKTQNDIKNILIENKIDKKTSDYFIKLVRAYNEKSEIKNLYTYRDILDELAQVTASTICLDENDKLELRYISNNAVDTIDEEYLKDINVNFG